MVEKHYELIKAKKVQQYSAAFIDLYKGRFDYYYKC